LTEEEIELARGVFGDQIDYSSVKIVNRTYLGWFGRLIGLGGTAVTPNGSIHLRGECGNWATCDDGKTDWKAMLIHEMTHVWQTQQGMHVKLRGFALQSARAVTFGIYDPYDFSYKPGKAFRDYGLEEQGDLAVEIYRRNLPNIIR